MQGYDTEQIDKILINYVDKVEIKKKNNLIIEFIDKNKEKFDLNVKFNLEEDAKRILCEINNKNNKNHWILNKLIRVK